MRYTSEAVVPGSRSSPKVLLGLGVVLGIVGYGALAEAQFRARGRARPPAESARPSPTRGTPRALGPEVPKGPPGPSAERVAVCEGLAEEPEVEGRLERCEAFVRAGVGSGGMAEFELARALERLGRVEDFERAFRRALTATRGRGLHREVLRFGLERAKRSGSLEEFARTFADEFRSPEEKLLLVELLLARGEGDKALALLERESLGAGRDVVLRYARLASEVGRAREAFPRLLRLIERDFLDEEAWDLALALGEETGQHSVLVERLSGALRRAGNYDDLQRLGALVERLADERVLSLFDERLVVFSERDPRGYLALLARRLEGTEPFDLDRLLARAESFVVSRPEFSSEVGALLLDHERVALGLESLRRAASRAPGARRALALGLERAASLEEKKARVHRSEAAALWKEIAFDRGRGTPSSRLEARRRLLAVRAKERRLPDELLALDARARAGNVDVEDELYRAEVLEALGETVRAEEVLARARERFPDQAPVFAASVEFYERRKQPDSVALFLRAWGDVDPVRRPGLRGRLVAALEATGSKSAALVEIEEGLAATPDDLGLLSKFLELAADGDDVGRAASAVVAAIARRGYEPELVLLLFGSATEESGDALAEALGRAGLRVRRAEQWTPLLAAAESSGKISLETLTREMLGALARFPEDRELELFALGRVARLSRESLSATTRDRMDHWLLSMLGRKERTFSRREVLSLLEREPPLRHGQLLLAFLRSPPDLELVPRVSALLRKQTSLAAAETESLLLSTESTELRHTLALELVRRGHPLSSKVLERSILDEDATLAAYVLLGASPSSVEDVLGRLPARLAGKSVLRAARELRRPGSRGGSSGEGSELEEAYGVYRRAVGTSSPAGREVSDAAIAALVDPSPLRRSAARWALVGATPAELGMRVLEIAAAEPSRLDLAFERALTSVGDGDWRRRLWSERLPQALRLVHEGLASDLSTITLVLELLEGLEPSLLGALSGPERRTFDGLLEPLAGLLTRGGETALRVVRLFPSLRSSPREGVEDFVRRALGLEGAVALAMRAELESWGEDAASALLVENFERKRGWVEGRRDLRSLGVLARSEADGRPRARTYLERLSRDGRGLPAEEAAALLPTSVAR